ncbi:TPA: flavodoxin family protein [Clostridioides difficile]|uniref:flavodoxin family protein n=1 Tax=Clostridioides difficile TaxID=1496 RepID=UPI00093D81D1|nr:flavodoxin family protein [Clostridioides difficile]MDV9723349.1 flavodoxin family protein [Clostridioides difficile]HBF6023012.1 flavodoxin family protein [Clostridioides difficile]HBG8549974.1 flavodoxin family protein [Clostridioides difficile]HBH1340133.1 flavodoxin family protein [Clostridioides difficile]HEK4598132.1 flavodoxin family protein [Clostridioides difficile]
MKKIVAYIGSRKGTKSNTYKFISQILEVTKQKFNSIEYEIITSNQLNIQPCNGCDTCFETAECPYDKYDDMGKLRQKIINSDFVIFGSPVYAHNVSGDLKIFFDRSSSWMHTMRLHGKGSMVCTTTSTSGHTTSLDYMSKIMNHYGSNLVAKYNCSVDYPEELYNEDWMGNTTELLSEEIIKSISNPQKSNSNLEYIFKSLKEIMSKCKDNNIENGELEYWKESRLIDYNTFQDFLDNEYNKN